MRYQRKKEEEGMTDEELESPKTWRELRTDLAALGAEPIRCRGSHETWRFADGETFIVVVNHLGDDVSRGLLSKYRRMKKRRSTMPPAPPSPAHLRSAARRRARVGA